MRGVFFTAIKLYGREDLVSWDYRPLLTPLNVSCLSHVGKNLKKNKKNLKN